MIIQTLILILLITHAPQHINSESYFYVMETVEGKTWWTHWDITSTNESIKMVQRDHEGIKTFYCQPNGSVEFMTIESLDGQMIFLGQKKGDSLVLSRTNREREEINETIPFWYQPIGPSLYDFILSYEKKREFFIINPENYKPVPMTIGKTGREALEIDGIEKETIKAELRLSGFLSSFWSGAYWFCAETGVLLKYEGDSGPGTPFMTMELISSPQKIAMIKGE